MNNSFKVISYDGRAVKIRDISFSNSREGGIFSDHERYFARKLLRLETNMIHQPKLGYRYNKVHVCIFFELNFACPIESNEL